MPGEKLVGLADGKCEEHVGVDRVLGDPSHIRRVRWHH